ncbi:MAG TPA: diacylglycerol kinase family protein [Burkholderiales bacterium]|nr:diacylglycerol kinase family protein [Burkholderiales bacterium]
MRVTLIHNEGAGEGGQPDGKALVALIKKAGHEVRYQRADEDTWAAALDETTDLVAVAGGDGTVGRVAKKLIGRKIPVAPLPMGTANNISKTFGLTELTIEEIVHGWEHARIVAFDAGVAKGPWGTRYFVEGMGVGLFARTIAVADESKTLAALKDTAAKVAYALKMLRDRLARCEPHELKLTLDGKDASGEYVLFEAMNMEFVGPNLYLAPDIRPADGLLDVVLVTTAERDQLKETLATWQDGELAHPDLPRRRANVIEIEWTGFQVHFDDEAWPGDKDDPPALTHIRLTVEHEALHFLVPPAAT